MIVMVQPQTITHKENFAKSPPELIYAKPCILAAWSEPHKWFGNKQLVDGHKKDTQTNLYYLKKN